LSRQRICAGSEIQVDGAETENAREEKLVVMLEGLDRRSEFEERKAGFPLFWKKKIKEFSSPILEFSMCFYI